MYFEFVTLFDRPFSLLVIFKFRFLNKQVPDNFTQPAAIFRVLRGMGFELAGQLDI